MKGTDLIKLKIQWDGNDFYSGKLKNYLDANILVLTMDLAMI